MAKTQNKDFEGKQTTHHFISRQPPYFRYNNKMQ